MTENELRELIETEGLTGMETYVYTQNRVYIGRMSRINVTNVMLADPKVMAIGDVGPSTIKVAPSVADTAEPDVVQGKAHSYVAVSIGDIEAIAF